ncbi:MULTISPECIES: hypothetical protein [unclassified Streptomyces]|uniref:hypothetical protein n=1 Tax=unclassified Streptomyces TaxID=2593676 RepID=UPI00165677FD|nr:hypothetical protein [Streptomyces sp. CB02980]MCB8902632.1 hypothetical protein [Streptomyces sp. CB02980]
MSSLRHIRFQSPTPGPRGNHPGVFGLTNLLAREGRLAPGEWAIWRSSNDWYDAHFPDPATADPTVYDPELNPGAAAWFRPTAAEALARVAPYLRILRDHGVPCVRLESADPGRVVYTDAYQIVVVPAQGRT